MTPEQLAKSGTEHGHQAAFFCWCAMATLYGFESANNPLFYTLQVEDKKVAAKGLKPVPELKWFHAIPNGGAYGNDKKTRQIRGARMKAEGVKRGVSDTCLPVKRSHWSGLYIEFKKPGGRASKEQIEFGDFVKSQGFGFAIVDNWRLAADMVQKYLETMG
jgi:hypothetical protein